MELRDLESNTATFIGEVAYWNVTAFIDPLIYSTCAGIYLLGGAHRLGNLTSQMDHYFQRNYTNLPPHTMIRYTFTFWALGYWRRFGADDYFQLSFDSQIVNNLTVNMANFPGDLCGSSDINDLRDYRVFGIIGHSSSKLDLRVISKLTQISDRLIGIREINFLFDTGPLRNNSHCGRAPISIPNDECPCTEGKFYNGSSCQNCDSSCKSCYGPSLSECFQCKASGVFDGTNCYVNCTGLEVEYIQPTLEGHQCKLSVLPSNCRMDINSQTLNLFPSLAGISLNFSTTITNLTHSEYLLNLSLHESPLYPIELNATAGDFSTNFTIPEPPIPPETTNPVEEEEEKPIETIDPPEKEEEVPIEAINPLEEGVPITHATMMGIIGASLAGTLALGATAALWSFISLQQFIGYFLYINVQYPSQVEILLSMLDFSIWSILPNPLDSLTSSLSDSFIAQGHHLDIDSQPPQKFARHEINIFFIENGGSILTVNIGLLLILLLVLLLKSTPRCKSSNLLKKMKVSMKWNMIARTFLENGIPLSLAIFLQLRSIKFTGAYLGICSGLTIISLVYFVVMCAFLMRILYQRDNEHLKRKLITKIYGTLHEGISLKTSTTKYYYMIILFRGVLLTFLIACMEDSPLLQIIPLIFYNIGFIIYLFRSVTFEIKILNIIIKVKELLILAGEFCIFLLVGKVESFDYYNVVGWVMVILLVSAVAVEACYILYIQIIGIKEIYQKLSKMLRSIFSYLSGFCKDDQKVVKIETEPPEISFNKLDSKSSNNLSMDRSELTHE